MFKRKSKIEVIKVRTVTRDLETEEYSSYGLGASSSRTTMTDKKIEYTQVLFIKDGELCTKEFNGKWDLTDVKRMES